MTISLAWVRKLIDGEELLFASDSRLTGGGHVDSCQKIFPLPREDCAISFCGHTFIAYPFIFQLTNIISEYKRSLDRAIDITELKGKITPLLNAFVASHKDPAGDFATELSETSFLFGGWSWRRSKFCLWILQYDRGTNKYVATDAFEQTDGKPSPRYAVIGDYIEDFRSTTEAIRASHGKAESVDLDYEPLQGLAAMLSDTSFTDRVKGGKGAIGGAPQLTKIYPFLRTVHFGVRWFHEGQERTAINGRILSSFEILTTPIIDPLTLTVTLPMQKLAFSE